MTHSRALSAFAIALSGACSPPPATSASSPPASAPTSASSATPALTHSPSSAPSSAPPPALASPLSSSSPTSPPSYFPKNLVHASYPWNPDRKDGSYQNPVLYADYSDPDVIRVGDDYYLVASSFQCTPGLPILHSRDLVSWTIVGHALENLPDPRYAEVRHGEGIWAPALREHAGKFYIFAPTPDEGIYALTASDPKGPWSPPKMLVAGKGLIDPCPLWDEDGKAYLVHAYARSRAGIRDRLRVRPMAPDASSLLGDGEIVFMQPERQPTIEGPKFYKRNGWYYILAPAGGVPTGWQVALRSRNVFGPYEDRNVLAQGATSVNGPHQGALVETPRGEWWFLHFQDAWLYGRVVHLNPVSWIDDWPMMGVKKQDQGPGEPVLVHKKPAGTGSRALTPQTSDEFDSPKLGLQWQWHANHERGWYSLSSKKGSLRLLPQPTGDDLSRVPNLLLQKLPATAFVAETVVRLEGTAEGTRAGLAVMGLRHAAVVVEETGGELRASLIVDNAVVESHAMKRRPIVLRVAMETGGASRFAVEAGDEKHVLGHEFSAVPGRWIGTKVGIFATAPLGTKSRGYADFEHFRFLPPGR